jgi:hypothetical protein
MSKVGTGQVTNLIKKFLQMDKPCILRTNEVSLDYIYEIAGKIDGVKYEGKQVLFVEHAGSKIHEIVSQ